MGYICKSHIRNEAVTAQFAVTAFLFPSVILEKKTYPDHYDHLLYSEEGYSECRSRHRQYLSPGLYPAQALRASHHRQSQGNGRSLQDPRRYHRHPQSLQRGPGQRYRRRPNRRHLQRDGQKVPIPWRIRAGVWGNIINTNKNTTPNYIKLPQV